MEKECTELEKRYRRTRKIDLLEHLKNQGMNFIETTPLYAKGSCPFTTDGLRCNRINEKDNFAISKDRNMFYCFGCHIGGDIVSFRAKLLDITPNEALEGLEKDYKTEL